MSNTRKRSFSLELALCSLSPSSKPSTHRKSYRWSPESFSVAKEPNCNRKLEPSAPSFQKPKEEPEPSEPTSSQKPKLEPSLSIKTVLNQNRTLSRDEPSAGNAELSTTSARELWVPKSTVDTQILENTGKSYLP